MATTFLEKAREVLSRAKTLESVPGSPWHDKSPGSPQSQGLPRISEHVVAFHRRFDVVFAGPCAQKAAKALKDFHDANVAHLVPGDPMLADGDFAPAVRVWEDCTLTGSGDAAQLSVPISLWNAAMGAFDRVGLGVTLTDLAAPVG